jgi:hypothetical protein
LRRVAQLPGAAEVRGVLAQLIQQVASESTGATSSIH